MEPPGRTIAPTHAKRPPSRSTPSKTIASFLTILRDGTDEKLLKALGDSFDDKFSTSESAPGRHFSALGLAVKDQSESYFISSNLQALNEDFGKCVQSLADMRRKIAFLVRLPGKATFDVLHSFQRESQLAFDQDPNCYHTYVGDRGIIIGCVGEDDRTNTRDDPAVVVLPQSGLHAKSIIDHIDPFSLVDGSLNSVVHGTEFVAGSKALEHSVCPLMLPLPHSWAAVLLGSVQKVRVSDTARWIINKMRKWDDTEPDVLQTKQKVVAYLCAGCTAQTHFQPQSRVVVPCHFIKLKQDTEEMRTRSPPLDAHRVSVFVHELAKGEFNDLLTDTVSSGTNDADNAMHFSTSFCRYFAAVGNGYTVRMEMEFVSAWLGLLKNNFDELLFGQPNPSTSVPVAFLARLKGKDKFVVLHSLGCIHGQEVNRVAFVGDSVANARMMKISNQAVPVQQVMHIDPLAILEQSDRFDKDGTMKVIPGLGVKSLCPILIPLPPRWASILLQHPEWSAQTTARWIIGTIAKWESNDENDDSLKQTIVAFLCASCTRWIGEKRGIKLVVPCVEASTDDWYRNWATSHLLRLLSNAARTILIGVAPPPMVDPATTEEIVPTVRAASRKSKFLSTPEPGATASVVRRTENEDRLSIADFVEGLSEGRFRDLICDIKTEGYAGVSTSLRHRFAMLGIGATPKREMNLISHHLEAMRVGGLDFLAMSLLTKPYPVGFLARVENNNGFVVLHSFYQTQAKDRKNSVILAFVGDTNGNDSPTMIVAKNWGPLGGRPTMHVDPLALLKGSNSDSGTMVAIGRPTKSPCPRMLPLPWNWAATILNNPQWTAIETAKWIFQALSRWGKDESTDKSTTMLKESIVGFLCAACTAYSPHCRESRLAFPTQDLNVLGETSKREAIRHLSWLLGEKAGPEVAAVAANATSETSNSIEEESGSPPAQQPPAPPPTARSTAKESDPKDYVPGRGKEVVGTSTEATLQGTSVPKHVAQIEPAEASQVPTGESEVELASTAPALTPMSEKTTATGKSATGKSATGATSSASPMQGSPKVATANESGAGELPTGIAPSETGQRAATISTATATTTATELTATVNPKTKPTAATRVGAPAANKPTATLVPIAPKEKKPTTETATEANITALVANAAPTTAATMPGPLTVAGATTVSNIYQRWPNSTFPSLHGQLFGGMPWPPSMYGGGGGPGFSMPYTASTRMASTGPDFHTGDPDPWRRNVRDIMLYGKTTTVSRNNGKRTREEQEYFPKPFTAYVGQMPGGVGYSAEAAMLSSKGNAAKKKRET